MVIRIPAITTPIPMLITLIVAGNLKAHATSIPVQAPVKGSGIDTKIPRATTP
jgi:hypothetical protein